jgi:hypothetical protein
MPDLTSFDLSVNINIPDKCVNCPIECKMKCGSFLNIIRTTDFTQSADTAPNGMSAKTSIPVNK